MRNGSLTTAVLVVALIVGVLAGIALLDYLID
jgi:hypothetical protein